MNMVLMSLCSAAWSQEAFLLGQAEGQRVHSRSCQDGKCIEEAPCGPLVGEGLQWEWVIMLWTS